MIDMQLLDGVLIALAVLVGAAIALLVAILAMASATKRGQAPDGGTRRDLPPHGGTRRDLPPLPQPDTDDARELVLRLPPSLTGVGECPGRLALPFGDDPQVMHRLSAAGGSAGWSGRSL